MNQDLELVKIYNELSEIEKECLEEKFKNMRTEDLVKENELNCKLEYLRRTYKNKLIPINYKNTEFNKNKEKCDADLIKEMVEQNIKKSITKENNSYEENEKIGVPTGGIKMNCKRCNSPRVIKTQPNPIIKISCGILGALFLLSFNLIGLFLGAGFLAIAFTRRPVLKCEECGNVF